MHVRVWGGGGWGLGLSGGGGGIGMWGRLRWVGSEP